jgi:hypothetical protein
MSSYTPIQIDFTNAADAEKKATWAYPDKLTITDAGLGWDGEPLASYDGWIQTKPRALGFSWRTTFVISVGVAIHPPAEDIVLKDGTKISSGRGDVYVRYSPDLKHWSTWQVLQHANAQSPDEKKDPGWYYAGVIRVPYRERDEYIALLREYWELDVPWKSDEEAAVRWILQKDPDFFARHLPFLGYIEFLYEGSFRGGQRIKSLKADVTWSVSGINTPPKDEEEYKKRDVPWRFKAEEEKTAEPLAPPDKK